MKNLLRDTWRTCGRAIPEEWRGAGTNLGHERRSTGWNFSLNVVVQPRRGARRSLDEKVKEVLHGDPRDGDRRDPHRDRQLRDPAPCDFGAACLQAAAKRTRSPGS